MKYYNSLKLNNSLILIFFISLTNVVKAQNFKIINYSVGYHITEMDGVGNNPLTISGLLKDPNSYQNFLNTLQYNGLSGSPGIQRLKTFYINTELRKTTTSRFWEKTSIQIGLLLTGKLVKDGMSLDNRDVVVTSSGTIIYINKYSLVQNQQFLGANIGLNRRFRISDKLKFLTGIRFNGTFAILHNYQNQFDSISISFRNGYNNQITKLQDIKGKNFFQWQAMIPLGLEMNIYKNQILIRLEATMGILGRGVSTKITPSNEAHGLGFWMGYRLN